MLLFTSCKSSGLGFKTNSSREILVRTPSRALLYKAKAPALSS